MDWFSIPDYSISTPDYFHPCNNSINGIVGVPNNFWGNQMPFHGDAYVGFVIDANGNQPIGIGEYLQCQLKETLKPCVKYKMTINVSLAERSANAFSKIGIVFSSDTLKQINIGVDIISYSNANYFGNSFISDSLNWVKLEFEYIATGNEKFMTIGYFNSNLNNDTMTIQEHVSSWPLAYGAYYLDSVSLTALDIVENCEFIIPNVISPNNDGINDVFILPEYEFLFQEKVVIYSRWGNEVAVLNSTNPFWTGNTISDQNVHSGTYFYIFSATTEEGKIIYKKGTLSVFR